MTISINGQPVDFTLDREETVADLAAALGGWAGSQGLTMVSLLVDGRAIEGAQRLQGIQAVEVEVVPEAEGAQAQLEVVGQFLALTIQAASAGNQGLLDELKAEFGPIAKVLAQRLGTIAQATDALQALEGPWSPEVAPHARILEALVSAQGEVDRHPQLAFENRLADLEGHLATQGNLGALFQKGDDADALGWILGLFTRWQAVERVVPVVLARQGAPAEDWSGFLAELAPFLRETEGALASQDYILVTDLLEYEVSPRLLGLRDRFGSAKQP